MDPQPASLPPGLTEFLRDLHVGPGAEANRHFAHVYEVLREIAHRHLARQRRGHTLGTTALVHEAYLRLAEPSGAPWQDRAHFFAVAARAMRFILVDYARRRGAEKRGGDRVRVTLTGADAADDGQAADLLDLDDALTGLAQRSERLAQVVELRFFGGLTVEESAEVLGVSPRTVKADWQKARLWLYRALWGDE
jgi:RNA polymerase sigma factor (TIGR02999 family)